MLAIYIIYTIKDAKGKTATTEVKVPLTIALANALAFAAAMAVLINNLTKGAIVAISLVINVNIASIVGIRTTPDADSDVEEKVSFGFLTDAGFPTGLDIPTADEVIFVTGSRDVDLTNTDVIDFTEAMLLGLSTTPGPVVVTPTDAHGDDIDIYSYGYELFAASGRRKR